MIQIRKNLLRSQLNRLSMVTLVFSLLTACQGSGVHRAYSGEAMPSDKIAIIDIPSKVNLLYLDDREFGPTVLSNDVKLELLPGSHSLVVEYDQFWDIATEQYERVTSQPVMLTVNLESGRRYRLQVAELKDLKSAKIYAKQPRMSVIEMTTGRAIAVKHQYHIKDQKYLAGFASDSPVAQKAEGSVESVRIMEYWWKKSSYEQQQNFLNWARSHAKSPE